MDKTDIKILELLAKGYKQSEISIEFKKNGVTPSSISIIEKRLKKIKKKFNAKTYFHLAFLLTKEGVV